MYRWLQQRSSLEADISPAANFFQSPCSLDSTCCCRARRRRRTFPFKLSTFYKLLSRRPTWVICHLSPRWPNWCRPVVQNLSPRWLSPGWFVAQSTVAQMVCRPDDWRPVILCTFLYLLFPFSAFTLLVGWQEGHPACKKLRVGLSVATIWLQLYASCTPVVTTTSIILGSNKIQNGDVLVPAYPSCTLNYNR